MLGKHQSTASHTGHSQGPNPPPRDVPLAGSQTGDLSLCASTPNPTEPHQSGQLTFFFNQRTLPELSNFIRKGSIRILGNPEEAREKGTESLLKEIFDGNFPNLGEELHFHIKKANRALN